MSLNFDKHAAMGNEIVNALAEDMKVSNEKAGRLLRGVLYALRGRISIDESLQVIAQLPMALKAVYVDQWDPWHSFRRIHRVEEFICELRRHDKTDARDLEDEEFAKGAVKNVFRTLKRFLSDEEFKDVVAALPDELKEFINDGIGQIGLAYETS